MHVIAFNYHIGNYMSYTINNNYQQYQLIMIKWKTVLEFVRFPLVIVYLLISWQ